MLEVFLKSLVEMITLKYYNTCTIWKNGQLIDRYRKMHLFDVLDSNGNYVFKESSVLSKGKTPTILNTPWGKYRYWHMF